MEGIGRRREGGGSRGRERRWREDEGGREKKDSGGREGERIQLGREWEKVEERTKREEGGKDDGREE